MKWNEYPQKKPRKKKVILGIWAQEKREPLFLMPTFSSYLHFPKIKFSREVLLRTLWDDDDEGEKFELYYWVYLSSVPALEIDYPKSTIVKDSEHMYSSLQSTGYEWKDSFYFKNNLKKKTS